MRGMYIHVPFCLIKCGYCDFYSMNFSNSNADIYTKAVCERLDLIDDEVDTVYFGGGTPSCIGERRICEILSHIHATPCAEITVECNPKTATARFMNTVAKSGVNRISIGLQSANDDELLKLTRTHRAVDVKNAVYNAKSAGIDNISLDIMIGIEGQTRACLAHTIDFCNELSVPHISAYMLKIEPDTPFSSRNRDDFPDDDKTADLFEFAVETLKKFGYEHYEISNFAKSGTYSKHNLKYWNCDEYYALGPAAYSFLDGKRYYYPRDFDYFVSGGEMLFDSGFDGFSEYAMLRLRLKWGLEFCDIKSRGLKIPDGFIDKCKRFEKMGLMNVDENGVRMTEKGMLVQNAVLCEIL